MIQEELPYIITKRGMDCLGYMSNLFLADRQVFKNTYWVSDTRMAGVFESFIVAQKVCSKLKFGSHRVISLWNACNELDKQNEAERVRTFNDEAEKEILIRIELATSLEAILLVRPYVLSTATKDSYKEKIKRLGPFPANAEIILLKTAIV